MRLVLLGDGDSPHLLKWARALAPRVDLWAVSSRGFLPGFDAWVPSEALAVRGLFEVLRHWLPIARIRNRLKRRLLADPPDAFVGILEGGFGVAAERRGPRDIVLRRRP